MRRRVLVLGWQLACAIAGAQMPPRGATDAAALLDAVARTYAADAPTFHIEAVTETVHNSDRVRSWQRSVLLASKSSGNRFRIEAQTGDFGSWTQVSDGTTEWVYLGEAKVYVKRPASQGPRFPKVFTPGDMELKNAWEMLGLLDARAEQARNATLLPDETIVVGGRKYPCYVVHSTTEGKGWHIDHTFSVDRDEDAASATHYLSVHGFAWPNFHDADGRLAKALSEKRIPLTVLIDAEGRIVYEGADGDEAALRRAIDGKLPGGCDESLKVVTVAGRPAALSASTAISVFSLHAHRGPLAVFFSDTCCGAAA